jgi:prepilin-type N-terminal cleavage/methylation domain-containing protein
MKQEDGFTLIELMIVLAIVGILATLAVNQYGILQAKGKRAEAHTALTAVWAAQQSFFGDTLAYADNFERLDFPIPDAEMISPTKMVKTIYTYDLANPDGDQSWRCVAAGDIDNDAWPDVLFTSYIVDRGAHVEWDDVYNSHVPLTAIQ